MPELRANLILLVLGAIWGGSFLFMKIAAPEFGVYALVEVRTLLATVVLLPFLIRAGNWRDMFTLWRPIVAVGAANTAIPFVLFNYSSLHLDSGVNAILNATAPMFGAIVAVVWLKDRLNLTRLMGLVFGFGGVILISYHKVGNDISLLPIVTALCATLGYGIAASMMKKWLSGKGALAIATGSQLYSSLMLLPFALFTWPEAVISMQAWWSATALAVFGTGIAYLMYFYLIANVGPTRAISVAYLVPLFGVIWGALFLSESLSLAVVSGGGLILLGVALTSGTLRVPERLKQIFVSR